MPSRRIARLTPPLAAALAVAVTASAGAAVPADRAPVGDQPAMTAQPVEPTTTAPTAPTAGTTSSPPVGTTTPVPVAAARVTAQRITVRRLPASRRVAARRAQRAALEDLRAVGFDQTTTVYRFVGTSLAGQTSNAFCRRLADAANTLRDAEIAAIDNDGADTPSPEAAGLGKAVDAVLSYGVARGCVFTQG